MQGEERGGTSHSDRQRKECQPRVSAEKLVELVRGPSGRQQPRCASGGGKQLRMGRIKGGVKGDEVLRVLVCRVDPRVEAVRNHGRI